MSVSSSSPRQASLRRLLTIKLEFKSPEEEYILVRELQSNQGTLVCHRKARFDAVMRQSHAAMPLHMLDLISRVRHPNIADILNVFLHEGRLLIVGEYMDISLLRLEFRTLPAEEWEIATVIKEVTKAMVYLLKILPECEVLIDSVRLSLQGQVKLVPDLYYEREKFDADNQKNSEFIAEILGFMMSLGMSRDREWSTDALEYSSLPTSDFLDPFVRHVFLNKAVSPSRLVPRIRLAMQTTPQASEIQYSV